MSCFLALYGREMVNNLNIRQTEKAVATCGIYLINVIANLMYDKTLKKSIHNNQFELNLTTKHLSKKGRSCPRPALEWLLIL
uniref:Uncharacterized protein n=1 Tax=Romanomermis culicivorax TaxID=13658 RepID=A0A915KZK9_ROMCU